MIVVIIFVALSIFYFIPQESEIGTLGEFTFCEPKEDLQKSIRSFDNNITWTKDYCLKIEDFQGTADFINEHYAQTQWRLHGYSNADLQVNKNETMQLTFIEIEVVAFFNKNESWVKSEDLTKIDKLTLLRHEQGHFDLAEEHARFIEDLLKKRLLGNNIFLEDDLPKTEYDAREKTNEIFDEFYYEIYNMDFLQDEYDRITDHGRKYKEQVEFNLRFDKLRE